MKAEFVVPSIQREVVITIGEAEGKLLKTFIGGTSVDTISDILYIDKKHKEVIETDKLCYELYIVLGRLFHSEVFNARN